VQTTEILDRFILSVNLSTANPISLKILRKLFERANQLLD
jgi:hypothetical protein